MRNAHFPIWFAFLLTACVGTDYENDPKDSAIIVEKQNFELMVGESETIEAVYHYNMWRPEPEVQLAWISEDQSIVAVSSSGTITGIAKGKPQLRFYLPKRIPLRSPSLLWKRRLK